MTKSRQKKRDVLVKQILVERFQDSPYSLRERAGDAALKLFDSGASLLESMDAATRFIEQKENLC